MKDEIRKELEGLNSTLTNENSKDSYEVPEGYFSDMQEQLINQIKEEKNPKVVRFGVPKWAYGIAAVFVLGLISIVVFKQGSDSNPSFENLETEAIYAYLDENLEDISMHMLIEDDLANGQVFLDFEKTEQIEEYLEEYIDDLPLEELEELL